MTCIATALQAGLLLQVSSRQCNNGICSFEWLLESRPFKLVQDGSMFCSSQFKVDLTISRKNTILNTVHFNTNTTWLKEELYIISVRPCYFDLEKVYTLNLIQNTLPQHFVWNAMGVWRATSRSRSPPRTGISGFCRWSPSESEDDTSEPDSSETLDMDF